MDKKTKEAYLKAGIILMERAIELLTELDKKHAEALKARNEDINYE